MSDVIPPYPVIIKSLNFPDRVADLRAGKLDNPVVGFDFHDGANQKWTCERVGDTYYLWTRTSQGERAYANTDEKAAHIVCNATPKTKWFVGAPRITTELPNGVFVAWTLDNGAEDTEIRLEPIKGIPPTISQDWEIIPAN